MDDMRVNFSSAWKANIFTHTGIANRVLREEISGLKKKNILCRRQHSSVCQHI